MTRSIIILFLLISFTCFPFETLSQIDSASRVISPENACSVTPNPNFCMSLIPPQTRTNFHDYVRFLVNKSLDQSASFSSLIDHVIKGNATLPPLAMAALNDCLLLSQLTTDFLASSSTTLNGTDSSLPNEQVDMVHTLLSAIITNQQTCYDGLTQASFSHRGHNLYAPLVNGSRLYSASLALFTHYWVPKLEPGRQLLDELKVAPDGLPRWVDKEIFRHGSGRRMDLQTVGNVVVAQDGSGNYRTITDAIAAAPFKSDGGSGYFVIHVKAGEYQEQVTIDKKKKYIMMVGDGIGKTIITGSRSVGGGSTTFNSATLAVQGEGFVAIGITVRNTAGPAKGQAVAVRNGADLSAFYQCSFEGYQDTLYAYSLRQFYRECDIYGTVDFIFGNAAAVFQNCNIYARLPPGKLNTVTAQGRSDPNQNTGTSIVNCNILAGPELSKATNVRTFLGRPWRPYSRTVVMQSNLGSLIDPAGWLAWSSSSALGTLYYGEYGNRGPGADTSRRVKWPGFHLMMANDAGGFTVSNFVHGDVWLPKTTVPFTGGLA
ncbi:pectinesterase-like [Nymphaea colorata]|nr:pectinesterase-like [Nymphaea colorata]